MGYGQSPIPLVRTYRYVRTYVRVRTRTYSTQYAVRTVCTGILVRTPYSYCTYSVQYVLYSVQVRTGKFIPLYYTVRVHLLRRTAVLKYLLQVLVANTSIGHYSTGIIYRSQTVLS